MFTGAALLLCLGASGRHVAASTRHQGLGLAQEPKGPALPTGTSLAISYGAGDPFRHEVGGGLTFYASGTIDTGTRTLPVSLEGRLFVPRNFASLMPLPLVIVGHGNHGRLEDSGWYIGQLDASGLPPSVCVVPSLTHGQNGGEPAGWPGASEENGWRMLVGAVAAVNVPGLVNVNKIVGFGYSLGAAANIAMMSLAEQYPPFRLIRGGASMGVGVYEGVFSWPQPLQVRGIRAPQVVINGQLDQYINHTQAMQLVNSLVSRSISPSYLIEYPGVDHFSLPSLAQAWIDAATVLRGFM